MYYFTAKRDLVLVAPFDLNIHLYGRCISYINDLYEEITGLQLPPSMSIVDFKRDYNARSILLNRLCNEYHVDGWIHPIESSPFQMEVCIINSNMLIQTKQCNKIDMKLFITPGSCAMKLTSEIGKTKFRNIVQENKRRDRNAWTPFDEFVGA